MFSVCFFFFSFSFLFIFIYMGAHFRIASKLTAHISFHICLLRPFGCHSFYVSHFDIIFHRVAFCGCLMCIYRCAAIPRDFCSIKFQFEPLTKAKETTRKAQTKMIICCLSKERALLSMYKYILYSYNTS